MTRTLRIMVFIAAVALAACGKMGPPEKPQGSTWPKGYPAGAIAREVPSLPNSGTEQNEQAAQQPTVAVEKSASFTKSGAWIDPNTNRPTINPTADQDKYHLNAGY